MAAGGGGGRCGRGGGRAAAGVNKHTTLRVCNFSPSSRQKACRDYFMRPDRALSLSVVYLREQRTARPGVSDITAGPGGVWRGLAGLAKAGQG